MISIVLFGCAADDATGPDAATAREGRELFASSPPPAEAPAWTIYLLPVDPARVDPAAMLGQVRSFPGLERARLADRGGSAFIGIGAFDDPTSREAQAEFARVRALVVDGRTPFSSAFMVPPNPAAGSATPSAHDLRNARAEFGRDALYSLQIGVYARDDNQRPSGRELASFREAAEQAAAALRAQGEVAFFLHGPINSIVTVGAFGPRDFDGSVIPAIESERLRAARERHPHNLLNGKGIMERFRGTGGSVVERLQRSELVEIPG